MRSLPDVAPTRHFAIGVRSAPYLADHGFQDMVVLPGSLYVEMALRMDAERCGRMARRVRNVSFRAPVILSADDALIGVSATDKRHYAFDEAGAGVVAELEIEPGAPARPPRPRSRATRGSAKSRCWRARTASSPTSLARATWTCARFVRASLPEYMVPAHFIAIERLPLTENGKLDRRALLQLGIAEAPRAGAVAPRTATEEMVMGEFRAVLERQDFGVGDNFFDLGGHSLMAARLMSRLRKVSGCNLALRCLFERPTVGGLAETIDGLAWLGKSRVAAHHAGSNREEIEL
jgi:aryl carrier-like protein